MSFESLRFSSFQEGTERTSSASIRLISFAIRTLFYRVDSNKNYLNTESTVVLFIFSARKRVNLRAFFILFVCVLRTSRKSR